MNAQVPKAGNVDDMDGNKPSKRPYVAPVLTKFGAIASLTRGSGGGDTDSGTST